MFKFFDNLLKVRRSLNSIDLIHQQYSIFLEWLINAKKLEHRVWKNLISGLHDPFVKTAEPISPKYES